MVSICTVLHPDQAYPEQRLFMINSHPQRKLLYLIALLVLMGCSPDTPQVSRLEPDDVILAFGDSLTYGTGASASDSYPAVLQKLTGRKVINAGVPGEKTAQGLQRLPRLLDAHQPNLLILCHGGNDLLRLRSSEHAAANLRAMIREARAREVQVLLVAVPAPGLFLDGADFYEEIAEEFDLPFVADTLPELIADPDMKSDPIHLNREGYRRLSQAVFRVMQNSGML
jgi:acyl-CoA thioesterase-1